ncbi:carbohydrate kinase family protein [Alistipes sp.]|uniref:carbohydrate kinase family protein n=1 Tax=Alistipes sp. TaxID=1872444 RepID=UPI003AB3A95D
MSRPKIMGIGELVWDMLPGGRQLGGAPVNFAYWCGRLGAEGYPVSAVGGDDLGREAFDRLAGTGLDLGYVQRNALPTGRVNVTLSGNGIPGYDIVEGVAWDALEADARTLELAAQADAVCWGSLAQRSKASRRAIAAILGATRPECLKVFDINIRQHWYSREIVTDSLRQADVLKLNEDELPLVASLLGIGKTGAETIAELIRAFSLRYVIYTAGADHSEIHSAEGLLSRIPTPQVEVADTVGAGDSFTAAFITSLLQGDPVAACHRKAVETAAEVCTVHGAIPRPQ